TYDLWQDYVKKDRPDDYYLRVGRLVTILGVLIGVGTAFIAAGSSNIMNYIQALFSIFNAPLFATFIVAMFWKRMTATAGIAGLVSGTLAAGFVFVTSESGVDAFGFDQPLLFTFGSSLAASFWGAVVAFAVDAAVSVVVSLMTEPKPASELEGLVYGTKVDYGIVTREDNVWWRSPVTLGLGALAISLALYIPFA
ncbi:MAG: sodium:solute symporter family transporter, partial [Actinomycetes bacterium]